MGKEPIGEDPFPMLRRPSQYVDIVKEGGGRSLISEPTGGIVGNPLTLPITLPPRARHTAAGGRPVVTQSDVKAIEAKAAGAGKRKRGRPVAPKPWVEAGVPRTTWLRREKAKAARERGL